MLLTTTTTIMSYSDSDSNMSDSEIETKYSIYKNNKKCSDSKLERVDDRIDRIVKIAKKDVSSIIKVMRERKIFGIISETDSDSESDESGSESESDEDDYQDFDPDNESEYCEFLGEFMDLEVNPKLQKYSEYGACDSDVTEHIFEILCNLNNRKMKKKE